MLSLFLVMVQTHFQHQFQHGVKCSLGVVGVKFRMLVAAKTNGA